MHLVEDCYLQTGLVLAVLTAPACMCMRACARVCVCVCVCVRACVCDTHTCLNKPKLVGKSADIYVLRVHNACVQVIVCVCIQPHRRIHAYAHELHAQTCKARKCKSQHRKTVVACTIQELNFSTVSIPGRRALAIASERECASLCAYMCVLVGRGEST